MNIKKIKRICELFTQKNLFGFLSPYVNLDKNDIAQIDKLVECPEESVVRTFEQRLTEFISGGQGHVITFGAGRMAFFSLLKAYGIGPGDEVCLTGFTCAVMANAVLRTGASPVYVDIDKDTLGMSASDLKAKLSNKTKVVVPQHSFGIPCEIDEIVKIAHAHNAVVIEDCAISLGTKYKGRQIGTWGDAAIFSTDHTKPLNTLIGGYAYTSDTKIALQLKSYHNNIKNITVTHIKSVLDRYIKESHMERKTHKLFICDIYKTLIFTKLHLAGHKVTPYLSNDATSDIDGKGHYPYPSKLHPALAYIGIKSLSEYVNSIPLRKEWMKYTLDAIRGNVLYPGMYDNNDAEIIPLRIAFYKNKADESFSFIDDWIWFKRPIIATTESLDAFGYQLGTCPVSEKIGNIIMNVPVVLDNEDQKTMINKLCNAIK